jgi:hypothetical protein
MPLIDALADSKSEQSARITSPLHAHTHDGQQRTLRQRLQARLLLMLDGLAVLQLLLKLIKPGARVVSAISAARGGRGRGHVLCVHRRLAQRSGRLLNTLLLLEHLVHAHSKLFCRRPSTIKRCFADRALGAGP